MGVHFRGNKPPPPKEEQKNDPKPDAEPDEEDRRLPVPSYLEQSQVEKSIQSRRRLKDVIRIFIGRPLDYPKSALIQKASSRLHSDILRICNGQSIGCPMNIKFYLGHPVFFQDSLIATFFGSNFEHPIEHHTTILCFTCLYFIGTYPSTSNLRKMNEDISFIQKMESKYEEIFQELKNFYNVSAVNPETNNSSGETQDNQIFFNNFTDVEKIAKIKWYGNKKIIFKVSLIANLNLPVAELSQDSEKSRQKKKIIRKMPQKRKIQGEKKNIPGLKKLLVTIILVDNLDWVTLVIKKEGPKYQVYYADFLGSTRKDLPEGIKNALQDPQYEIINCTEKIEKRADESKSVIIALKDADVIIKKLSRNENFKSPEDFKRTFGQANTYSDKNLQSYKEKLKRRLHEKEKMESKIKICGKIFDRLNNKPIKKFSYENVNAFLFFLEATALEGSSALGQQYLDKVKDDIIGRNISNVIKEIRKLLLHSHYPRVIEQNDLDSTMKKLVTASFNYSDFFSQLGIYIKQIDENLQNNAVRSSSSRAQSFKLTNLLKSKSDIQKIHEKEEFGQKLDRKNIRKKLSTMTRKFLKQIGEKPDAKKGEEIMFNLIVNFMNVFGAESRAKRNAFKAKGLEEIRKFRNVFFHNFHKDDETDHENPQTRNFVLKEGMRRLLDYYFKYDFCLSVCESLLTLSKKSCKKLQLQKSLSETLKTKQDDWKKKYSEVIPKLFEQTDEENVRDGLETFVHEYLNLMIVIDNDYVKTERESERIANKNQVMHRKFNSVDRKHIYSEFKAFKDSLKMQNNKQKIEDLAKKLKDVYGIWIPKSYLKQMEDSYVKNACVFVTKELEKNVCNDIRALLSIRNDYKLSTQNVIDLYDYSIKKKDNSVLLNNANLSDHKSITEKLNGLASDKIKFIDRKMKNKNGKEIKIELNVAETNRNLFEMFDDVVLYPSLSMNIDEIFSDSLFLDYLLNEKIEININFLNKLVEEQFTAPYVAKLIIANKKAQKCITKKIFSDTVKNLLTRDRFCEYLKELLEATHDSKFSFQANSDGLTLTDMKKQVYDLIKDQIHQDNIQFNILCLFKKPELVKEILSGLDDSEQKRMGLRVLERAAIELCQSGNYDTVSKILKIQKVGALIDDLLKEDKSDIDALKIKRREARTKNKMGKHDNAFKIFDDIYKEHLQTNVTNAKKDKFVFSLFVLSDLAYTHHLKGEYEEASEKYKILYKKLIKYPSLAFDSDDSQPRQLEEEQEDHFFLEAHKNKVEESDLYKKISELGLGPKYLKILKIKSDIAYELCCLAEKKDKNKLDEVLERYTEALNIYKEVYEIKNKKRSFDIVKTMSSIAYVSTKLGTVYKLLNRKNEALEHHNYALLTYHEILGIQEKERWRTHPATSKTREHILQTFFKIAKTHNQLSFALMKTSQMKKEALKHQKQALILHGYIRTIYEITKGKDHDKTKNAQNEVGKAQDYINQLEQSKN